MKLIVLTAASALALTACGQQSGTNATGTTGDSAMADNIVVPPSEGVDPSLNAGNATAAMPVTTTEFAQRAAMSDMYEIESSRIAQQKATSPAIKDFARMMITAHQGTTRDLKAALVSDKVSVTPPTALDAEHQGLIDALNNASGAEFDRLYKQQQADAHHKTLTLMQTYATTGDSAAVKSFAAATAPKVQQHLDQLNRMN